MLNKAIHADTAGLPSMLHTRWTTPKIILVIIKISYSYSTFIFTS